MTLGYDKLIELILRKEAIRKFDSFYEEEEILAKEEGRVFRVVMKDIYAGPEKHSHNDCDKSVALSRAESAVTSAKMAGARYGFFEGFARCKELIVEILEAIDREDEES